MWFNVICNTIDRASNDVVIPILVILFLILFLTERKRLRRLNDPTPTYRPTHRKPRAPSEPVKKK